MSVTFGSIQITKWHTDTQQSKSRGLKVNGEKFLLSVLTRNEIRYLYSKDKGLQALNQCPFGGFLERPFNLQEVYGTSYLGLPHAPRAEVQLNQPWLCW